MKARSRYRSDQNLKHYFHRNQQYSINAMTNGGGTVVERYAYNAYGTPTIMDGSGTLLTTSAENNRYLYTGRDWDEALDLYHYRARMYNAVAGRFCSRDPIAYRGSKWNLYEYVKSAPVRFLDPLGLQLIEEDYFDFVERILRNEANGSSIHPAVSRAIECNANIHCGSCDGFEGETFASSGRAQICLNKGKLTTTQGLSAILVHEAVHAGQMLDNNECLCKKTPHKGRNPTALPVGGGYCVTCEEREADAYRQQGEFVCPPDSPGCQDYIGTLIAAGVCKSCRSSCKKYQGAPCPPYPKIPFPL